MLLYSRGGCGCGHGGTGSGRSMRIHVVVRRATRGYVALELYEVAAAGYTAAGDAANASIALTNGGIALQQQGRDTEARPLFAAALTEQNGGAHERTLYARMSLGGCMLMQGEHGAARVELEAAVGAADARTLTARENLASLLATTGDHAAAAAAYGRVVAAQTQPHGVRNWCTLAAQAKWAKCRC